MRTRHPDQTTLQNWLNGEGDADVDLHIGTCRRCASNLEELESVDEAAISEALAEILAPPVDLTDRLEQGVAAKLSSRQIMNVIADLFGAGFETTRLLLTEDQDDND